MINSGQAIEATTRWVKELQKDECTGHDWWHTERVRRNALLIAEAEGGDPFVVEMAALLHDVDDWKFATDENRVGKWLLAVIPDPELRNRIADTISRVSYKGSGVSDNANTPESKAVQDADRLDAMGAIGIARTFAYGGAKGRPLYEPGQMPAQHSSFEDYRSNKTNTINHFYEKLLLLYARLNTATARKMAKSRHELMEKFLQHFFMEWGIDSPTEHQK